jgi:uncharacterized protein
MGERTSYTPGTFSWTDLTTTDQDAAKAFYGGLFGWEFEDFPVGGGAVYSMARLGGKDVAAISAQPQQMREAGAPPTWNSYVTVESADAASERARELGANVVSPPFDVMDAGRMAVLRDPEGAFLMLWQPYRNPGASLVNAPGALCWNELGARDLDGAAGFYRDLFGWEIAPFEGSPEPYLVIQNRGRGNGGIRPVRPPDAPPHWAVYFAVEDLDAARRHVEELGGVNHTGPMEIAMARISVAGAPQGATFLLYDGELED